MPRVIIADDHQMFVDGIKSILIGIDHVHVVGEATNGLELISLLESCDTDVVLMDVNMPEMNGIEATKIVISRFPEVKVLMLTMHDSRDYIQKLLKAGAHGYILKNTGRDELEAAINAIVAGDSYFSKEVTERIMEGLQGKKSRSSDSMVVELTDRELDVLKLIAQEFTTREIGEKLYISHHTVETHRKNLISKLQVRGSAGLVKYAIENDLLD